MKVGGFRVGSGGVAAQRLTRLPGASEAASGAARCCCAHKWGCSGCGWTGVSPVPPSMRLSKLNGIPLLGVLISMPAILLLFANALLLWIWNED